ncbi:hypothetical protein SAMN02745248_02206 [Hathewaya proteolytica DSM 3090]|uniref:Anti-sigma factor RsgI-like middle domain-containing protein n=1 Tax=Hathewaya proteolytica DSM 3090 TaxID=1121331 RepID=A0A1M6R5L6_9CLOT|nr:hypothetical protein [Hathewaya proteolytica]SHK27627.1 hypothetical protein SAMN02745248_02206 [Hathewaya proteolytica DSM 3090]
MKKVGKVINIKGNKIYIVTKENEFCILKRNSTTPKMNSIYAGEVYNHKSAILATIIVILISILILAVFKAYEFFSIKTEFIVEMGGRFKISVNNEDKITNIQGNNPTARNILKNKSLKYKSLDEGLSFLFQECIKEKKILPQGDVTFYMTKGSEEHITKLSKFNKLKAENSIYLNINTGGEGIIE